jgi:hypothetical protein
VDASRGDDHAVRRITQGRAEKRAFFGDVYRKRKDVQARIRFKFLEYLGDRTDRDGSGPTTRVSEDSRLLSRKALWIDDPTNQDVSIQQRSERQS